MWACVVDRLSVAGGCVLLGVHQTVVFWTVIVALLFFFGKMKAWRLLKCWISEQMFGCVQSWACVGEQMFGSSVPGEAPFPYFYIFLKMCLLPPSTFVSNKKVGLWGWCCCRLVVVSVRWLLKRLDIEKILWYNCGTINLGLISYRWRTDVIFMKRV